MPNKDELFDDDIFGDADFGLDDAAKKTPAGRNAEMSEILKKFKARAKEERALFYENVDSEYWVAIGFQSREQKEAFLRLAGWLALGDKYLDGLEVAEAMGIDIAAMTPPIRRVNIDRKWMPLVGTK